MQQDKKKTGRPLTGGPIRRVITVSMNDDEIAELNRLAEEANMSRSEFIRFKTLGKKE